MAPGRKTGGKPKGFKAQKTLDKEAAREVARHLITRSLQPMIRAQVAHALGIGHLYTRDTHGKFTKIEDQSKVDQLLMTGTDGSHFFIFTKDPSTQAFTDLLNRALDKPKEQEQAVSLTASEDLLAAIRRRRRSP